jgi:hypothetical protein
MVIFTDCSSIGFLGKKPMPRIAPLNRSTPIAAFTASSARTLNPAQRARAEIGRAEPFRTAEEAWFWTISALTARREGTRYSTNKGLVKRPCEPDDVVRCLDTLYLSRRIDLAHARILRAWGERGAAPDPRYASERADHCYWKEAMDRLEWPLRVKGIVA